MNSGTLSCSTNCFAVWAVTSGLYWLSWMISSSCRPRTPPAALISLTASLAPLAAGTSSEASSPVSANPPPILIVPPGPGDVLAAVLAAALAAACLGSPAAPHCRPPRWGHGGMTRLALRRSPRRSGWHERRSHPPPQEWPTDAHRNRGWPWPDPVPRAPSSRPVAFGQGGPARRHA